MSTGELLSIEPQELQFQFELKKQISCSMQLRNDTNDYVAFKELLRHQRKKSRGGISFMYVVIIGLLGFILGYLLK
ncbi:hypothetical protein R6Q57_007074 [Mikania cordata]